MITYETIKAISEAAAQRKIAERDIQTEAITEDATATVLFSIETLDYERGLIEFVVNGIKEDADSGITVHKVFSYKNIGGTLTVHSAATLYSQSDFTTATVTANANGTVIEVKVTGEAATNINWSGIYEQTKMNVEVAL